MLHLREVTSLELDDVHVFYLLSSHSVCNTVLSQVGTNKRERGIVVCGERAAAPSHHPSPPPLHCESAVAAEGDGC